MAQSNFLKTPTAMAPDALTPDEGARALPANPRLAGATMGDSASPEALLRLNQALLELQRLRTESLLPLLHRSVAAMREEKPVEAAELAIEALKMDERCGVALAHPGRLPRKVRRLHQRHEVLRDRAAADTGRAGNRQRSWPLSLPHGLSGRSRGALHWPIWRRFPPPPTAPTTSPMLSGTNSGSPKRLGPSGPRSGPRPRAALLWNTLGTVLAEQGGYGKGGDLLRRSHAPGPEIPEAPLQSRQRLAGFGCIRKRALIDCVAALKDTRLDSEVSMMKLARATMLIAGGELGAGWDAYEARLEPHLRRRHPTSSPTGPIGRRR